MIDLRLGDCLKVLKDVPSNSIDACVTDPPYGLSFMGKSWDYDVPSVAIWREVYRVLKPGGHLISFSGTRTYHMMTVKIENAGFEIRDMLSWLYGSGFPKSHNVSKGIDNSVGAKRLVVGTHPNPASSIYSQGLDQMSGEVSITSPASPAAKKWDGWGSALKPAMEPAALCMKPLEDDLTIADNVMKHGTGALNIDASRIGPRNAGDSAWEYEDGLSNLHAEPADETPKPETSGIGAFSAISNAEPISKEKAGQELDAISRAATSCSLGPNQAALSIKQSECSDLSTESFGKSISEKSRQGSSCTTKTTIHSTTESKTSNSCPVETTQGITSSNTRTAKSETPNMQSAPASSAPLGRWPSNCLFDEIAAEMLDAQSGLVRHSEPFKKITEFNFDVAGKNTGQKFEPQKRYLAGASRFFYVAKASKRERNAGLDSADLIWESETWQRQDLNSLTENINQLARGISDVQLMVVKRWSTDGSGLAPMDPSLPALTSTIETVTKLIIDLRTSNASQSSTINESILDAIRAIEASGSSLAESAALISPLKLNIISEKTVSALGAVHALLQMLSKLRGFAKSQNFHSTVKPIALMEYLIRLITPPGGTVLDPFMGSGSTGVAAAKLGFSFLGIEMNEEYLEIARRRIAHFEKS